MAYLDTPELPDPKSLPQMLVGAASPLWAYFGAATAGGVAFWWMTQWARPANLEALFSKAAAAAEPVVAPVLEAAEAVAELPPVVAEVLPALAEEPVVEAAPEPEPVAAPEPALDAAPEAPPVAPEPYTWEEPAATMGLEPEAASEAEPAPKPRVRKGATPSLPE
jgi:hypothetical protein